jgi:glycosyltransferase involved in cell wall biosynthesis
MTGGSLVSAVVPTFKREKKLRRAIESIDAQTYNHIEVVIVNGDPETSVDHIESSEYQTKHIQHDKNYGISKSRNDGIKKAEGEYIAFLDDDDEWKSQKIEKQVNKFRSCDPECGLVYSGRELIKNGKTTDIQIPINRGDVFSTLLCKNFVGSETAVVKASCIDDVGSFNTDLNFAEDYDLWLRIARKYKIEVVAKSLAINHIHSQDSLSSDPERRYRGMCTLIHKYKRDLEKNPTALAQRYYRLAVVAHQTGRTAKSLRCLTISLWYDHSLSTIRSRMVS